MSGKVAAIKTMVNLYIVNIKAILKYVENELAVIGNTMNGSTIMEIIEQIIVGIYMRTGVVDRDLKFFSTNRHFFGSMYAINYYSWTPPREELTMVRRHNNENCFISAYFITTNTVSRPFTNSSFIFMLYSEYRFSFLLCGIKQYCWYLLLLLLLIINDNAIRTNFGQFGHQISIPADLQLLHALLLLAAPVPASAA
jgi:hypothetical protein